MQRRNVLKLIGLAAVAPSAAAEVVEKITAEPVIELEWECIKNRIVSAVGVPEELLLGGDYDGDTAPRLPRGRSAQAVFFDEVQVMSDETRKRLYGPPPFGYRRGKAAVFFSTPLKKETMLSLRASR